MRIASGLCMGVAGILLLSRASASPPDAARVGPPETETIALTASSQAALSGVEEGARLLTAQDGFVRAMSPYDRSARLKVHREVSLPEYLAFVAGEVRPWSAAEGARMRSILDDFRRRTRSLSFRLPPVVRFVKTSGREEGRAAYCRGPVVVLPENILGGDPAKLSSIVFHELFHVFSTSNPEKRGALYAVVGFEPCPEIPLPPALAARKVTNPDAPRIDAFCRVDAGGEALAVTPVLLGRSDLYDTKAGGEFFEQMDFRLMAVEPVPGGGGGYRPALSGAEPRLLALSAVPDYFRRVGRNTEYVIHPEEVLADNFVLLIEGKSGPSPEILKNLSALLKNP